MNVFLAKKDILKAQRKKVYSQTYQPKKAIHDVKIIPIQNIPSEEGDFSEVVRFEKGALRGLPHFKPAQMNRTRLLPGSVKAWHLHFKQDYVWYLSPFSHMIVGLWDLREDSPTKDATMRIVMGSGQSQLIYIPHGVAQGSMVVQHEPVELYIFSNMQFDISNLDEQRLPWDSLGAEFWTPHRD